jgi:hypothetical protein
MGDIPEMLAASGGTNIDLGRRTAPSIVAGIPVDA